MSDNKEKAIVIKEVLGGRQPVGMTPTPETKLQEGRQPLAMTRADAEAQTKGTPEVHGSSPRPN
jgi:hypothetical protein